MLADIEIKLCQRVQLEVDKWFCGRQAKSDVNSAIELWDILLKVAYNAFNIAGKAQTYNSRKLWWSVTCDYNLDDSRYLSRVSTCLVLYFKVIARHCSMCSISYPLQLATVSSPWPSLRLSVFHDNSPVTKQVRTNPAISQTLTWLDEQESYSKTCVCRFLQFIKQDSFASEI